MTGHRAQHGGKIEKKAGSDVFWEGGDRGGSLRVCGRGVYAWAARLLGAQCKGPKKSSTARYKFLLSGTVAPADLQTDT